MAAHCSQFEAASPDAKDIARKHMKQTYMSLMKPDDSDAPDDTHANESDIDQDKTDGKTPIVDGDDPKVDAQAPTRPHEFTVTTTISGMPTQTMSTHRYNGVHQPVTYRSHTLDYRSFSAPRQHRSLTYTDPPHVVTRRSASSELDRLDRLTAGTDTRDVYEKALDDRLSRELASLTLDRRNADHHAQQRRPSTAPSSFARTMEAREDVNRNTSRNDRDREVDLSYVPRGPETFLVRSVSPTQNMAAENLRAASVSPEPQWSKGMQVAQFRVPLRSESTSSFERIKYNRRNVSDAPSRYRSRYQDNPVNFSSRYEDKSTGYRSRYDMEPTHHRSRYEQDGYASTRSYRQADGPKDWRDVLTSRPHDRHGYDGYSSDGRHKRDKHNRYKSQTGMNGREERIHDRAMDKLVDKVVAKILAK